MESMRPKGIESTPERCGGKPCLAGTRIRVWDIYVWHDLQGLSPDEIIHNFPQLTLADVHAALAYFWAHHDEIRRQMKQAEDILARIRAESGPGLLDDVRRKHATTDTLPSG